MKKAPEKEEERDRERKYYFYRLNWKTKRGGIHFTMSGEPKQKQRQRQKQNNSTKPNIIEIMKIIFQWIPFCNLIKIDCTLKTRIEFIDIYRNLNVFCADCTWIKGSIAKKWIQFVGKLIKLCQYNFNSIHNMKKRIRKE